VKERKSRWQRALTWILIAAGALGLFFEGLKPKIRANWRPKTPIEQIKITGAVVRQDKDSNEQSPIGNARITATGGLFDVASTTDAAGFFQLFLRPSFRQREPITLTFEHDGYKPAVVTGATDDRLYVVRMKPAGPDNQDEHAPAGGEKLLPVRDVRVRYSVKSQTTINVGSLAKRFQVVNTGSVPCAGHRPCSPDGQWKATTGTLSLDAGNGNQFRNVRVTCIAGPCPFTSILPGDWSQPSRRINVSVLGWSDTATFLVEAEVTSTAVTDATRRSYPTIIGQSMTFALPAAAEGHTVEAQLNGEEIVFPLGPKLILSWATCSVEVVRGLNKTYRCELKPGYVFPQ
jgi:hypothetical protein